MVLGVQNVSNLCSRKIGKILSNSSVSDKLVTDCGLRFKEETIWWFQYRNFNLLLHQEWLYTKILGKYIYQLESFLLSIDLCESTLSLYLSLYIKILNLSLVRYSCSSGNRKSESFWAWISSIHCKCTNCNTASIWNISRAEIKLKSAYKTYSNSTRRIADHNINILPVVLILTPFLLQIVYIA